MENTEEEWKQTWREVRLPPWTRERRRRTRELNVTPTEEDVRTEWEKIKEKAPGEDEVRMIFIKRRRMTCKLNNSK